MTPGRVRYRFSDDDLLTTGEVARLFRVGPRTVGRWARDGKLPAVRTIGGHRRYRYGDVAPHLRRDEVAL